MTHLFSNNHREGLDRLVEVWSWRNASLLSANMSIANASSLQLKAGMGPVQSARFQGWRDA